MVTKTKTRTISVESWQNGSGVVSVTENGKIDTYDVREIGSDFGRCFRVEKRDGDSYDVCVNGRQSTCECLGHLKHGHCRHVSGLAALIAQGRI